MIQNFKSHRIEEWYYHLTWIYMRYSQPVDYEYAAELIIKICTEENDRLSELQLHKLAQRTKQIDSSQKYKPDQLTNDNIAQFLPEPLEDSPTTSVDAKTLQSNDIGNRKKYVKHDKDGNKTYVN